MTKYRGADITFARNTTGSTFVDIGQVLELGKVGSTRSLNDASAYGEDWNDYILGKQDGAEVALRIAFDPSDTQHAALKGDYEAAVSKKFRLTQGAMTPDRVLELTALVTEYMEGGEQDGPYEAEITLKIVNPGVTVVP